MPKVLPPTDAWKPPPKWFTHRQHGSVSAYCEAEDTQARWWLMATPQTLRVSTEANGLDEDLIVNDPQYHDLLEEVRTQKMLLGMILSFAEQAWAEQAIKQAFVKFAFNQTAR